VKRAVPLALLLALAAGAGAAEPARPAAARLVGHVFERGTITPIAGARVDTSTGESTTSDERGRFELRLPAGAVELLISAERHQPLRVTEQLVAGQGIDVEYRLLPATAARRYESTVRGEARHEGERFTLRDEELHRLPGGLGDPFRVIGMLPGVATPLTLLPLFVIRGASPGTNGFFLDGMRVPQLFHFLVGGGVVHAQLVDRLDFYPGVYDVSFGRYAGGIIDSETRPARPDGQHGEVELRLYDVSTLIEAKLPKGVRLEVGGHYGWPGFLVHAVDDRVDVNYWDYQLRLDWRGLTVEALGSFDSLTIARDQTNMGITRRVPDEFRLTFHRLQIRERDTLGRTELEAALVGGIDEAASFGGMGVRKLSLGGRLLARARWTRFRLFGGVDGEVSQFTPKNFSPDVSSAAPDQLGDLGGNRVGVVAGAFLEGTVDIIPRRLWATAGARIDTYHAGEVTLLGVDPRLELRARLLPWLSLNGGIGVYQQPPSFPVALPGIDTFALQLGLQRAYQSAVGVAADLPLAFHFTLTGFYQKFQNVNDIVLDLAPAVCTSPPPESLSGFPALITRQVDGQAFGMELLLRRTVGRVTGWIAYTLSRSERIYSCGLRPADFDQAHVLNIVVQVRLPWNLMTSARLFFSTGRPVTLLEPPDGRSTVRNNSRLPDFVQLDLRIDREWIFRRWALSAFLEVVNTTYSKSVFGLTYPEIDGVRRYDLPQVDGFNWILPSVGLRGRY
jgi:hypothetical protein